MIPTCEGTPLFSVGLTKQTPEVQDHTVYTVWEPSGTPWPRWLPPPEVSFSFPPYFSGQTPVGTGLGTGLEVVQKSGYSKGAFPALRTIPIFSSSTAIGRNAVYSSLPRCPPPSVKPMCAPHFLAGTRKQRGNRGYGIYRPMLRSFFPSPPLCFL